MYIGPLMATRRVTELSTAGITHFLACNGSPPLLAGLVEGFTVEVIEVDDEPGEADTLVAAFGRAHRFIDAARRNGHALLVYCTAGVSRSATVVLSYMMRRLRLPYYQALRLLRE